MFSKVRVLTKVRVVQSVRQLCVELVQLDSDPQHSQYKTSRSNRYQIVPTSLLFFCTFTVCRGCFVKLRK